MAKIKHTDQPQVTIVIPTHDHRCQMVLEAVQSVIAQRYVHWKAVVIDNASPDDTADAIEALKDPRIELVRHATNLGPSGGRNTGIARAQTPWIAFLDSDDIWEPDFLELVMEQALQHPEASLISTRSELFREDGKGGTLQVGFTPEIDARDTVIEHLLRHGNFFATSTVVVRTDAVRALGGFDPTLTRSEDTDLWIRLALHYPALHLSKVLVRIRLHGGTTQASEDPLEKLHRRIYICSKALASLGEETVAIKPLLRRRLRVSWRERAEVLSERGRWGEAATARRRQWSLRRLDPKPLFQWTWCHLRSFSGNGNGNGHDDGNHR